MRWRYIHCVSFLVERKTCVTSKSTGVLFQSQVTKLFRMARYILGALFQKLEESMTSVRKAMLNSLLWMMMNDYY
ncbi:hypothetical protein NECAME_12662, partial [Necator americanus]